MAGVPSRGRAPARVGKGGGVMNEARRSENPDPVDEVSVEPVTGSLEELVAEH